MPARTRFLNPHFFGFCGLYYLTDKYFVFAGMISSPIELYSSGILIFLSYSSIFTNLSHIIEIKRQILVNLSCALILPLFTICQYLRSSWYRLQGIRLTIFGQRSSRLQYNLQDGSCNISILMLIPIKDIISAPFVLMDL